TWLRTHSYPEESGCEFAARALLRGRLTMPSPPDARELDYPFVDDAGGHRFGVCGPAQTVLVAAGRLAGRGWFVVPALLVGASGLGLLVQPFDVIAVGLPLALLALWRARGGLRLFLRESVAGLACALPLALVWLGVNRATTGQLLVWPVTHYFRRWGGYSLG